MCTRILCVRQTNPEATEELRPMALALVHEGHLGIFWHVMDASWLLDLTHEAASWLLDLTREAATTSQETMARCNH